MSLGRVTLKDVAAAAGVHRTTVARALNNHPGIPAETREKIQALAAKMGYSPDPALSALATYRVGKRPPAYHGVLAWLDMYETRNGAARVFKHHFNGAYERARQLGYRLESFWAREPRTSAERLSTILRQRGIQGIVISPLPHPGATIELKWDWFSTVALSSTVISPRVHLVHSAQYETMRELVQLAYDRGYQRPGLINDLENDARVRGAWSSGFLSSIRGASFSNRSEGIFSITNTSDSLSKPKLLRWLKSHQPDVLICIHTDPRDVLTECGYRVPQDIACLWVEAHIRGPAASGAHPRSESIGAAAIDLLTSCINRGERGIPERQLRVLVGAGWQEGTTIAPAR